MASTKSHNVRILGGSWKHKRIRFSKSTSIRPTPVRARQVLFSWLQFDLIGQRVLDLFAGSGILGFEALSRGAQSVTFVDNSHAVCSLLKDNCKALSLSSTQATVVRSDAKNWLTRQHAQWDLVFLDPPFKNIEWYTDCLQSLQLVLPNSAFIYVESSKRVSINSTGFQVRKSKTIGEVHMELLSPLPYPYPNRQTAPLLETSNFRFTGYGLPLLFTECQWEIE